MRIIYGSVLFLVSLQGVFSYSKYGRKCEDIGCASNEECVMATKTCSYFDREDECGQYPTCKRINNNARTCQTYVCPPSKVCKMDGGIPKCFDDSSKVGSVPLYDTSNLNNKYNGNSGQNNPSAPNYGSHNNPNAPSAPREDSGSLYPSLGGGGGSNYGQNNYRPQGGYSNPGYQQPGYGGGYQQPSGSGGYNTRPGGGYGYQGSNQGGNQGGYNQGGYNQGGYRPQQGGYSYGNQQPYGYNHNYYGQNNQNKPYPTQVPAGYYVAGAGYQQPASGGYNSGYNNKYQNPGYGYNQGNTGYGNNPYGNTGYGQNTNRYGTRSGASSSFSDSLTEALKKIGLLILVGHYFCQR